MLTRDIDYLFFGLNGSLNRLVNELLQDSSRMPVKQSGGYPPINYKYNKKSESAIIQYALAGFKKQDVSVSVKNNTLVISVKKREANINDDIDILHNGIARRSFSQEIACTEDYQAQKANVSFQDGILVIQIPKTQRNVKLLTIN